MIDTPSNTQRPIRVTASQTGKEDRRGNIDAVPRTRIKSGSRYRVARNADPHVRDDQKGLSHLDQLHNRDLWRHTKIGSFDLSSHLNCIQKGSPGLFRLIEAREFRMTIFHFPNKFGISTFLSFIATVSDSLITILQSKFYMKAAVNTQVVQFEAQGICHDEIWARLHFGRNRASRVLRFCRDNSILPCIPPRERPKKVTPEIHDFIDVCILQSALLSFADLSSGVWSRFGTPIGDSTVGTFKKLNGKEIFCANHRIVIKTF
jgi:hypothetical protein